MKLPEWSPGACPIAERQSFGGWHIHDEECWPDAETRPSPPRRTPWYLRWLLGPYQDAP